MMQTVELLLMLGLIVCAVAANFTRRLLPTVIKNEKTALV